MLQVLRRLAPVSLALALAVATAPPAAVAAGPDFSISASPPTVLISSNGSTGFGRTAVMATSLNGFAGSVAFTVSGLPTGVTATVTPAPGAPNEAEINLTASASAAAGTTNITVTGTSASLSHSISVPVRVVLPVSDFTVLVDPTSATISPGSGAVLTVQTPPFTGFTGTVTFTASGVPAGVTASFGPTTTNGSGASTATLTLTAASSASPGTSTITVTAHAGSVSASATLTLTVVSGTGGVVATPVVAANGGFFDEDDLKLTNPASLTSLSVTIVVQRTSGVSFNGQYNTVGGQIVQSSGSTAAAITYQFTLAPGQTLSPGSGRVFAAQMSGTGAIHPTGSDTFSVTYTTGGVTFSQSGSFPG